LLDAAVVEAGGVVAAVVAGTAGEAFAAPEGYRVGALRQAATGVGGAEDGDDGRLGEAGKVERAGVVRDCDSGGVQEAQGLGERMFADEVGDGEVGEGWAGPLVVRAAGEDDLVAGLQERGGEGDIALDGPAAEGVVAENVSGACGDQGDAGLAWDKRDGVGWRRWRCDGRELVRGFAVGPAGEDAGVFVGVVAAVEKLRCAIVMREEDLAAGSDGQGEEFVAGVVVERGAEVEASPGKPVPESEQGAERAEFAAVQEGGLLDWNDIDPRIEGEDGGMVLAADPMDLVARLVHGVSGRDGHNDIADGAELDEQKARHRLLPCFGVGLGKAVAVAGLFDELDDEAEG